MRVFVSKRFFQATRVILAQTVDPQTSLFFPLISLLQNESAKLRNLSCSVISLTKKNKEKIGYECKTKTVYYILNIKTNTIHHH